ncbi:hypothetical protein M2137_000635 [Parabacteroides sp. PFB2-10]|uniref:DUF3108 domain-containing protein n=1 Tax=Parabacteroides sp. PFB2-10 TaxID=1742405 RepID=UPI00247370B4|nr:DUF3108 domain-containing protein [Parabacteroides sp. PFB2-10]MDH6311876.1 hypothetical protein [Parabacteroides sp. PFB2-10]
MKNNSCFILVALLLLLASSANAQQNNRPLPFRPGEELTYDMHVKVGIISAKAGTSQLTVSEDVYNGQNAFRFNLLAKSSGIAKSIFSMEDTLTSYTAKDLKPLAYLKDAHEAGDHTIERASYIHSSENIEVKARRIRNGELRFDTLLVSKRPVYDMLSILYYARTFDYSSMKKGDRLPVAYFTGRRMENMLIEHQGFQSIRANDGRDYDCIKLVLLLDEKVFEDGDAAMTVYISNDQNKVPIRVDSKLKIGTTRIVINKYKL